MAGEDSVDVARMREAASRMDAGAAKVTAEKAEVEAAVARLASFTGGAADIYRNAMKRWYDNADSIIAELKKMANQMRSSADTFELGHNDAISAADDAARNIDNVSASGLAGL